MKFQNNKGARHCSHEQQQWERCSCPCERDTARKVTLFINATLCYPEAADGNNSGEENVAHEPAFAYWLVTPVGKRGRAAVRCYTQGDITGTLFKYGECNVKEVWL
jgi:hypothetical protein